MPSKTEQNTIEQLVSVFGFPRDRSRLAVEAIGDKSDVQMAYNWLLDHGEEDRGGAVEMRICEHADHANAGLLDHARINMEAVKAPRCSDGCSSGEVWMCLCCGDVRCSRYVNGHNLAHFKATQASEEASLTVEQASRGQMALGHFAAIGLRDLSVWCYHCAAYVTNPHLERLRKQVEIAKFGAPDSANAAADVQQPAGTEKGDRMRDTPWQSMHGFKGDPKWEAPIVATVCNDEARPGYDTMPAHEYLDTPETLRAKVSLLASWVRKAKAAVVYSGAGISTAAGVKDYASVAEDSIALAGGGAKKRVHPIFGSPLKAVPTLSHCVLSQLHFAGLMPHWIQQNHDGLPQKAGFPQQHINEIHGSWFDVSNPVVPMSGTLREDLLKWLLEWEAEADLCIAVGTSLCGMNADRVVTSTARRASSGGFGSVIISLQQTQLDSSASLRIFAKSDDVFGLLASELGVATVPVALDESILPPDDKFDLPYDPKSGRRSRKGRMTLDLGVGRSVRVINQPEWDEKRNGNTALVVGKTSEGDYMLNFGGRKTRTLGHWWLIHALKGEVPFLPIVNAT